ncbi:MAG: hypothetical protein OXM61_00580 [Candidatus Poribacteria bacterium]|nr:hypothetical protein [Candidatus Poribacteria bacterium]
MSKITDKLFRNNKVIFEDRKKNIKVSEPEIPGDPVIVERIDKNRDLKLDLNNRKLKRHIIKDGKINFKIKDNS